MAARTIWTGSLSFGLVNVPIGLYTATRDRTIHFNQFEEGTADRIRYRKVNERTGEEVDGTRIVKGVDLGGGEYVVLSDEELEAAAPERSRTIDITEFVDLDDIDPVFFRTTYYLGPQGEAAVKAYSLLRAAMRASRKVGIATFVMRGKEYLVAVRPEDEVLALETMYFADEVREPGEVLPDLPAADDLSDRELSVANLLIDSMADEWDPERYHDTFRARVEELVEQKRRGEEIVTESPVPRQSNVVDLMEALQASVAAVKESRTGTDGGSDATSPARPGGTPRAAAGRRPHGPRRPPPPHGPGQDRRWSHDPDEDRQGRHRPCREGGQGRASPGGGQNAEISGRRQVGRHDRPGEPDQSRDQGGHGVQVDPSAQGVLSPGRPSQGSRAAGRPPAVPSWWRPAVPRAAEAGSAVVREGEEGDHDEVQGRPPGSGTSGRPRGSRRPRAPGWVTGRRPPRPRRCTRGPPIRSSVKPTPPSECSSWGTTGQCRPPDHHVGDGHRPLGGVEPELAQGDPAQGAHPDEAQHQGAVATRRGHRNTTTV